jgi:hypothetical protein
VSRERSRYRSTRYIVVGGLLLSAIVLGTLVSESFGLHRHDVLYLSSGVYSIALPVIATGAAVISALAQVRRARNRDADGAELVMRELEPARWIVVLAVRAIGFGLLIAVGAYYYIGMAVSYTSHTPIRIEDAFVRLWRPSLPRGCDLYAAIVSPTVDSTVCLERFLGSSHVRLSGTDGRPEGTATIIGRRGFLGAVADRISMHAQPDRAM